MRDDEFYLAAGIEGTGSLPAVEPQESPIVVARKKAQNYQQDKKLYIVRGEDLFEVASDDIQMGAPINGERTITIKKAKLVKYSGDGRVVSD